MARVTGFGTKEGELCIPLKSFLKAFSHYDQDSTLKIVVWKYGKINNYKMNLRDINISESSYISDFIKGECPVKLDIYIKIEDEVEDVAFD